MYAVVATGGKQYRVEAGSELLVERVAADAGSSITFDRVLLIGDGDSEGTVVVDQGDQDRTVWAVPAVQVDRPGTGLTDRQPDFVEHPLVDAGTPGHCSSHQPGGAHVCG